MTKRLVSLHGVHLTVPDHWSCLEEDLELDRDRLAVFFDPDPNASFADNLVVAEVPTSAEADTWWASIAAALELPMLLSMDARDDGWVATVAHLAEGRAVTCRTRVVELPGRTLHLTATSLTIDFERLEPSFTEILESFACEGLP